MTLPCTGSRAWDLPDRGVSPELIKRVRKVAALCSTCPALDECRACAVADPPAHRCVQGGLVFDRHGGMQPEQWVRWVLRPNMRPERDPSMVADGAPCAFCATTMPRSSYGRRYCSERCKRHAAYAKVRKPADEPCGVCGQDPGATPREASGHRARHAIDANMAAAAERRGTARRLHAEGVSLPDIARRMRLHPKTVQNWFRVAA